MCVYTYRYYTACIEIVYVHNMVDVARQQACIGVVCK